MASLFTPESERIRAGQKKAAEGTPVGGPGFRVPGSGKGIKGEKPGDSLGNPNSPGYEPWGKKKGSGENEKEEGSMPPAPGGKVIETTSEGPKTVRLSAGWELLIVAQKKICEKAKGIFTLLEGPVKYTLQKRNKSLLAKSRGCILDLDSHETQEQIAWRLKQEKEKQKESA